MESGDTSRTKCEEDGEMVNEANEDSVESSPGQPGPSEDKPRDQVTSVEGSEKGISKNQLKKLRRTQQWEARKGEKRLHEREKKKEKRKLLVEAGVAPMASGALRKRLKKNRMKDSKCHIRTVIDCSFDKYMTEKDINKLVSQIQYCYSSNRRAQNPLQLYVSSASGATHTRLQNCGHYTNWDVNFQEENYTELFKKDEIVYLSSESENVLQELDASKVYIIGGLVDHNTQKGLCHRLAVEGGFSHAQLPIGEFIKLKSRKVLAINHVFEILLHFTEVGNWEEAFNKVIPKRKIAECDNDPSEVNGNSGQASDSLEQVNAADSKEDEDTLCTKTEKDIDRNSSTQVKSQLDIITTENTT